MEYLILDNCFCIERTSSLWGLYRRDNHEQILPNEYELIEIINTQSIDLYQEDFHLFHVRGGSYDYSSLFVYSSHGYYTFQLGYLFHRINFESANEFAHKDDTNFPIESLFLVRGFFNDGSSFLGSFLYSPLYHNLLCLQVPIQYDRIVYGSRYIAARNVNNRTSPWTLFFWEGERIQNTVFSQSKAIDICGCIKNIAIGQHEPYPIIDGKVQLFDRQKYDFIAPAPCEEIDIVLQNNKYGLYDTSGSLVLQCLYDSIIPNLESYPIYFNPPGCDTFSIEQNRHWGVFDIGKNRIVIPCILDETPRVVSGVKSWHGKYSFPISFICKINHQYGVIRRNSETLIPFNYETIESDGYEYDDGGFIESKVYYFCWKGRVCTVFSQEGVPLFNGLISKIDRTIVINTSERDEFGHLEDRYHPFFICMNNKYYGLYNESGVVFPCTYDAIFFDGKKKQFKLEKGNSYEYYP